MLRDILRAVGSTLKRRSNSFPNLERFAKGDRAFLTAVRSAFPGCKPHNIGESLTQGIDGFVTDLEYSKLVAILDALREFWNPDCSSQAAKFWDAVIADCILRTESRLNIGCLNSLWGITPIVNLHAGVAADRSLNMNAKSLVFSSYYISSNFDIVLSEIQSRLIAERREHWISLRWIMLFWAITNYDIFHLYNDRGIVEPAGGYGSPRYGISLREMQIYRRAGKRLYTYAYGADHRTRQKTLALGKWSFCSDCPEPGAFCVCDDVEGSEMLRVIREHSTAVIAHGLAMNLIPGARNIPYIAVDVDGLSPKLSRRTGGDRFLVGHFPNHGYFKGSQYLERAIERLQAEGRPIELLTLSGKPRDEILKAMTEIDVLVDQLVSGSFGLTAVEAMALGCPVICYLHDGVAVAEREACPVIPANPDTIEGVLRDLTLDRRSLAEARSSGPAYVRRNYSVQSLAGHLADLYLETADLPDHLKAEIAERAKNLKVERP